MKFKLSNVDKFPSDEYAKKLETLGFEIDTEEDDLGYPTENYVQSKGVEIEINTLEELMNFIKEWGQIIMDEDSITIYDDYNE